MGNCEGNTYNIEMGRCVPVLGPIELYYTKTQTERYVSGYTYSKEEIDKKTSGRTSGCCITPEEVDEKISSAVTQVEGEIPSLDGYATTEQMNTAIEQSVSGKADSSDVTAISGDVQSLSAEVQTIVVSGVSGISSAECQSMIDESISGKADTSSLALVATSGDYDDLTNKPTIPAVPTSNTAFTNDAQYATSGYVDSVVSGKLDTSVFQTYSGSVESEMGNKQDASGMTAYTQNTAFTAHTSDATIHVTSNDKSAWNNKASVSAVTEADWSVISGGTLDNNTIYLIY